MQKLNIETISGVGDYQNWWINCFLHTCVNFHGVYLFGDILLWFHNYENDLVEGK